MMRQLFSEAPKEMRRSFLALLLLNELKEELEGIHFCLNIDIVQEVFRAFLFLSTSRHLSKASNGRYHAEKILCHERHRKRGKRGRYVRVLRQRTL